MILLFNQGLEGVADAALKASPLGTAIYGILVFFLITAIIALGRAYLNEKKDSKKANENVMAIALKFSEFQQRHGQDDLFARMQQLGLDKLADQNTKIIELLQDLKRNQ